MPASYSFSQTFTNRYKYSIIKNVKEVILWLKKLQNSVL